jgi:hypothetical protein
MYRTSHPVRIFSAALAAVVGIGLVATAGGALSEERPSHRDPALQLVKLEPVIVTLHPSPRVASGCSETPKVAM